LAVWLAGIEEKVFPQKKKKFKIFRGFKLKATSHSAI
jgi:hypothetical protein